MSVTLAGRTVLVMGLGRFGGGVDAARFAAQAGARVIVTDQAPREKLLDSIEQLSDLTGIEYHLGAHDAEDFATADVVIANPAVRPDNEYLQIARRNGRAVTSQIGLFFQSCPARIVGITGANGKSTTTTLTAHLLEHARPDAPQRVGCVSRTAQPLHGAEDDALHAPCYCVHPKVVGGSGKAVGSAQALPMVHGQDHRQAPKTAIAAATQPSHGVEDGAWYAPYERVWLSGNIGDRPLLTILDQIDPRDLVVLEISSFQIEQLAEVEKAPHISLLTNLTPNHLDRYGTFDAYCASKEGLFQFQPLDAASPAISIFNAEDEVARAWLRKYEGQAGRTCLTFRADDVSEELRVVYNLPGRANLSNLAAARAIARCFGISDASIRDCLGDFKALPHRLELVGDRHGVRWYNDSKATTPEGTMVALAAFEGPKVLIAGGYDKHTPFDELGRRIASDAKAVILIGQTANQIAAAVRAASEKDRQISIHFADSLAEAVGIADRLALAGDVVLLSPACASYDMFENYQQRGRLFAELVQRLGA